MRAWASIELMVGNGQYELYYGYAHRPILQSATGGPPTRVGGWESWAGREVAMGTAAG